VITETNALLLRKVDVRESDLVVTLFTDALGKVSALARGARRSKARFAGSLEPLHTLRAELTNPRRGDLFELSGLRLERTRLNLTASLARMNAAGRVLSWVQKAAPDRQHEPSVYRALTDTLDALDAPGKDPPLQATLAVAGLRLCAAFGWGLDFDNCVGCGNARPFNKSARVDAARGGIVCSSCGTGGTLLDAALLGTLSRAQRDAVALDETASELALTLVERVLVAHGDLKAR
jgi:DNA repair protein RecO (recombination protein O)